MNRIDGLNIYAENPRMMTYTERPEEESVKPVSMKETDCFEKGYERYYPSSTEPELKVLRTRASETENDLSDSAKKLLEELREKYGNMDFIIADYDNDEEAKALLDSGMKEYSVLIDPETIEKMAADEEERAKYTELIEKAASDLSGVMEELGEHGDDVKTLGVTIDGEGKVSYYALLEKTSESRNNWLAQEKARRDAAKAEEKKAAEAEAKERLEEQIADARESRDENSERLLGIAAEKYRRTIASTDEKRSANTLWSASVFADTASGLAEAIKNYDWNEAETVTIPVAGSMINMMG